MGPCVLGATPQMGLGLCDSQMVTVACGRHPELPVKGSIWGRAGF